MKPIWKWVIGVAAGLILVIIIGTWYLGRRWKPLVERRLQEAVSNGTDGLYRIRYDAIDFSLLTGNATITDVTLVLDTAVYGELEQRERAPDLTYDVSVKRIRIGGAGLLRMLIGKKLHLGSVTVDTPAVDLVNRYHPYNDTIDTETTKQSLYARIAGFVRELKIGRVAINGGRFALRQTADSTRLAIATVDLVVDDFFIDSLSEMDTARFYGTHAIDLEVSDVEYIRPDGLYTLTLNALRANTDEGRLLFDSLRYYPIVSMAEFYSHKKVAEDMVDMDIPRVELSGIRLAEWSTRQAVVADLLRIERGGTIDVSKDLFYPEPIENKIGRSPHQHLLNLKVPLAIDSVLIDDLDVSFAQLAEKSREASKVTFDRISGFVSNAANDSVALTKNRTMVLDVRAKLMGAGDLSVRFDFDMLDEAGGHVYRAQLGPMDGRLFNQILTPLMPAEIASADIRGLRFDMRANNHRTAGTQHFDYRDLKINVLKAKDEAGERDPQKLASFVINQFVVNDSNPDANGQYHVADIDFERPITYSFFKMIWQGIFEGVKQCVGLNKRDEERLIRAAARGE